MTQKNTQSAKTTKAQAKELEEAEARLTAKKQVRMLKPIVSFFPLMSNEQRSTDRPSTIICKGRELVTVCDGLLGKSIVVPGEQIKKDFPISMVESSPISAGLFYLIRDTLDKRFASEPGFYFHGMLFAGTSGLSDKAGTIYRSDDLYDYRLTGPGISFKVRYEIKGKLLDTPYIHGQTYESPAVRVQNGINKEMIELNMDGCKLLFNVIAFTTKSIQQ
jgi:hypothetical protein